MMLYIMAGVDGAGKSTCYEILKSYLKETAIFIKESYTSSEEEKMERIDRAIRLAHSGKDVIYDRATFLDDLVYEPVMHNQMSRLRQYAITHSLLKDVKILYFECELQTLISRLELRGDDYVSPEHLPSIAKSYEELFEELELVPYRFNTTYDSPANVAAQVLQIVHHKPFKLAQIVPVESLSKIKDKGYQMCLANIAKRDSKYAQFYKDIGRDCKVNAYVLMDNGAAEGEQLPFEDLLKCYRELEPDEIVLPDTLCDKNDTLFKSHKALRYLVDEEYPLGLPFRVMAVPQGENFVEWEQCMREMIQWPEVNCLGISKFLQMKTDNSMIRWLAAKAIEEAIKEYHRYDIEVHLLGCSETPSVIEKIANDFPFVRGCDSAYGYICTQADVNIYRHTERPEGHIDFINGKDYEGLSNNLTALEIAIGVHDNSCDVAWSQCKRKY